ncbi:MAG: hypothetical protein HN731_16465 [Rhodospirillaceae bacterium]|jgi:hypothetical protein|nr:hypothetical protein [Rhodospirillaceae bacterium]
MSKRFLPKDIQDSARRATLAQKQIESDLELHPKIGRPKKSIKNVQPVIITADTKKELKRELQTLEQVLGPRTAGNKRLGSKKLYADLLAEFGKLQKLGITLPSKDNLSKEACAHGLGDVLYEHGRTKYSVDGLLRDSTERKKIAKSLGSQFATMAKVTRKHPPKDL